MIYDIYIYNIYIIYIYIYVLVQLVVAHIFCQKKKSRESISGQVSGFGAVVLLKLCVCGVYVVRMWCVCGALL